MAIQEMTTNLKKLQRRANRLVHSINRMIEHDELWKGRFVAYQVARHTNQCNGWAFCTWTIEFKDKKTGFTCRYPLSEIETYVPFTYHLYERLNHFITMDCKVWQENPRPSLHNNEDYTTKKIWTK